MAAVKGVVIEGLEDLEKTLLDVAPREARAILQKVVDGIAVNIRDQLRAKAPVRTGNLRQAIVSAKGKGKRNTPTAEVRITSGKKSLPHDAFYWHFIEFGTSKMRARPFIVPTVEAARPGIQKDFKEGFGPEFEATMRRKAKRAKK